MMWTCNNVLHSFHFPYHGVYLFSGFCMMHVNLSTFHWNSIQIHRSNTNKETLDLDICVGLENSWFGRGMTVPINVPAEFMTHYLIRITYSDFGTYCVIWGSGTYEIKGKDKNKGMDFSTETGFIISDLMHWYPLTVSCIEVFSHTRLWLFQ